MPDAHSGPAFATLVGLAMLAGGGTGDIRDLATPEKRQPRKERLFGPLVAALKQNA